MPKTKSTEKEFLIRLDRLPQRELLLGKLKELLRSRADFYGFEPIATPAVENFKFFAPLLKAGMLEEQIPAVCKTRAGDELFLRPSVAVSILRAYVSHKLNDLPHPMKFIFEGASFYLTDKRSGKLTGREEWGLVMLGEEGPIAEAEIVQVIWKAFEEMKIGLGNLEVRINATGCSECRSSFRSSFGAYYRSRATRLCKNCKRYLKKTPTKVLLCEEEKCRMMALHAPPVLDFLCEACKKHLRSFLEFLDEVHIPYFLDPHLFKEGSLYNKLMFEIWSLKPGADAPFDESIQGSLLIAEGGRMSKAGELVVGRPLDVASGTVFLEDLEKLFLNKTLASAGAVAPRVFLAHLGELARRKGLLLLEYLREGGIEVRESLGRDSVKSQLKIAERLGAEIALILGQKEAIDNTIIVREVVSGMQETIPQEKLIEFLKRKLKK